MKFLNDKQNKLRLIAMAVVIVVVVVATRYFSSFFKTTLEQNAPTLSNEISEQNSDFMEQNPSENLDGLETESDELEEQQNNNDSVIPTESNSILSMINSMLYVIDGIIILLVAIILFYKKDGKGTTNYVDGITQLANRQKMKDFYEKSCKNNKDYIFAIVGLDNFDVLNNLFSYKVGSQFLKNMADAISPLIGENELVARLKEDHFGLLLKVKDQAEAEKRLKRVLGNLSQIKIKDGESTYDYRLSYSIGVNLLQEEQDFRTIMKHTLATMESAEYSSEQKIRFFDQELKEQMVLQDELMVDMCRALQDKEFVPYFHMQFDTQQEQLIGAEVSTVWQHPEKGIVKPKKFIPVLKKAGLLLELDMIVLEGVCEKQRKWIDKGVVPLPLTVYITRLNIHRIDFFDRVKSIVERYQISPSLLVLEITEAAIYDNINRIANLIKELKEYGFGISVSDFGSKYSFLNVMRVIPIDSIKLEKDFFPKDDITEKDKIVIKNLIETAKKLEIQVIAEDVETEEQVKFLKSMGCNIVQGYSYPKPISEKEYEELVFH